jgi:hypothetical protein
MTTTCHGYNTAIFKLLLLKNEKDYINKIQQKYTKCLELHNELGGAGGMHCTGEKSVQGFDGKA